VRDIPRGHLSERVSSAPLLVVIQTSVTLNETARDALIVLLAIAMGVQNAMARKIGVPDLTTTVLTLTLTGLSVDSRWVGGTNPRRGVRVMAVAAMLTGALAGGVLVLHVSVAAAVGAATALLVANGLVAHRLSSSRAPWTSPP